MNRQSITRAKYCNNNNFGICFYLLMFASELSLLVFIAEMSANGAFPLSSTLNASGCVDARDDGLRWSTADWEERFWKSKRQNNNRFTGIDRQSHRCWKIYDGHLVRRCGKEYLTYCSVKLKGIIQMGWQLILNICKIYYLFIKVSPMEAFVDIMGQSSSFIR